ncbi:hypothetical protein COW86_01880, partial [Candidatus Kuenenbacteria bacterium CG22_combo_CG10-13_8_21_14_all_39_9]
ELTEFRNIFYNRNNIKIIPKNITAFLTEPISLAVWYMDDGKLDYRPKDHYAFSLTINNFLLKEAKILSDMLLKNFGIISSIQNPLCRGKRYPMLYIGKNGRDKFLKIVKPYIIDCFSHKLPPIL